MKKVMRNKKVIAMMVVGLVAIFLATSGVIASPPMGSGDPPVESKINYQGQLTHPVTGDPLSGNYDMQFQFYDAATGGSQVGTPISKSGVQVTNGLFNVKLDVNQADFNGQGLWLEVMVGGETLSPRQEILPVPYALSLKAGAEIEGEVPGNAVLRVTNTAGDYGIWARGLVTGIYGETSGEHSAQGVYGKATYEGGIPVPLYMALCGGRFEGVGFNTYGVWASGWKGVYGEGRVYGVYGVSKEGGYGVEGKVTNGGYGVYGVAVGSGEVEYHYGGYFDGQGDYGCGILAKAGFLGYAADFRGNVIIDGALIGAFPRPAYDSGPITISAEKSITLYHNLGGDPYNYVVDLIKIVSQGIQQPRRYCYDYGNCVGQNWANLTPTSIDIINNDNSSVKVGIRIWVYK